MTSISTAVETPTRRGPRRLGVALIVLQLWVLVNYLLTGPLSYYWRALPRAAGDGFSGYTDFVGQVDNNLVQLLLAIPGLLTVSVGWWAAALSPAVATVLIVVGASALAGLWRSVPRTMSIWLAAVVPLDLAFLVFSLTPAGHDIQLWILD